MKILYLITKSNWGGAQKYIYELATASAFFGEEVTVAFGGKGELFDRLQVHKEIELYSLSSLQRNFNPLQEVFAFFEMYQLVKKCRPDIFHVNSSKAAGLGAVIGRLCGIKKIVLTLHGAPFREDRNMFELSIIRFATWLSCLFVHKVITVSKKDEFDIANMPFLRKKVTTIYNGLLYEELPQKKKRIGKETQILSVAELNPNKGLTYALSAISLLIKKGYHLHYTIVGEGSSRSVLERAIYMKELSPYVTLKGQVADVESLLYEYDMLVLPSVKEGLPYILLEAGRAMVPVVASMTGGVPEIIIHEKTGLLVKPKDIEGLAAQIEKLLVSRELGKELSQNLREHVVVNFSRSKMLAETRRVYGLV